MTRPVIQHEHAAALDGGEAEAKVPTVEERAQLGLKSLEAFGPRQIDPVLADCQCPAALVISSA
jgi:hypothetical protein